MKVQKLLFYLLIFVAISDTLSYIGGAGFGEDFFTTCSSVFKYLALFLLIALSRKSKWGLDIPQWPLIFVQLFLIWNVVTIIRGAMFANDYWDWKFLSLISIPFFLIPLALFVGKNPLYVRIVIRDVLKYLFSFGFLIIPLALVTNHQLYSRLMIPVSVMIVFIPYLKPKWRKLILFVMALSIIIVLDFRTNIIKSAISLFILSLYYLRRYILNSWLKLLHFVIFALPIVLLILGITGTFNVFKSGGDNNSFVVKDQKTGSGGDESLTADTRTFLYVEVFKSLIDNGTLIIGEGGAGKYKSKYFDVLGDHRGRYSSEVGLLNIVLYSGIIGLVIYFLILFLSSYYAIYHSNNFLCKMLGLLIAARWLIFFIEEFTSFDLNTLFTWIVIGLICNKQFRSMSDHELKLFFKF